MATIQGARHGHLDRAELQNDPGGHPGKGRRARDPGDEEVPGGGEFGLEDGLGLDDGLGDF